MNKIKECINRELKVAVGCTEPIAIAYAAGLIREYVPGNEIKSLEVEASGNIIKNAMAVTIPGTKDSGIAMAAALGVLSKNAKERQLEILSDLKEETIAQGKKMVKEGIVQVRCSNTPKRLLIKVILTTDKSQGTIIIENEHTNVSSVEVDGEYLVDNSCGEEKCKDYSFLTVKKVFDFAGDIDLDEIPVIKKAWQLNKAIGEAGLKEGYGLKVGFALNKRMQEGLITEDLLHYGVALTAAASDARMAGAPFKVMSNSGSGNQGIVATLPVVATGEMLGCNEEEILRALTLSHLMTIYIKQKFGVLSALCGATIAGTGAACGIAYLFKNEFGVIARTIQNMVGNVTGMLCDGAKGGCALKVASCTESAFLAAFVALDGYRVRETDGINEKDVEKTIDNVCRLSNYETETVDTVILDIMLNKELC